MSNDQTHAQTSSAAAQTTTQLQCDAYCQQCGYNLRAIDTAADCPECGHPIAESLQYFKSNYSPKFNENLLWGVGLFAATFLSMYFIKYLGLIHRLFADSPKWTTTILWELTPLMYPACLSAAAFILTRNEPYKLTSLSKRFCNITRLAALLIWLPTLWSRAFNALYRFTAATATPGKADIAPGWMQQT